MVQLTPTEGKLLELIAEYRLLSTRQICALRDSNRRITQKFIESLYKKGCIKTYPHTSVALKGRPENISSLSIKGAEYLKTKGVVDEAVSINSITEDGITHKGHEQFCNWFRIHLQQIDKNVQDLKTDFISANTPFLPRRNNGMPAISDIIRKGYKDEWFVPDGVFSIKNSALNKRLLFFLEMDCATESIISANKDAATISRKVKNYQAYFKEEGYKRYEKKWADNLTGFRLLFITTGKERKLSISRYLKTHPSFDFIWITDMEQIFLHGLGGKIWLRGGEIDTPLDSILGPTLAFNSSLPRY